MNEKQIALVKVMCERWEPYWFEDYLQITFPVIWNEVEGTKIHPNKDNLDNFINYVREFHGR